MRYEQPVVFFEWLVVFFAHTSSFGYRPGRSAHGALQQCQDKCIQYAWAIDVDIKGFFDNINHEKMLQLLPGHTQENWVMLYVEQ